jgi:hypothetical protein
MPANYDEPLDEVKYPPVEFKPAIASNSTWRIEYPFADMGKNDFFLIYDTDFKNVNCIRGHAKYFVERKQPWAKFTVRPKDASRKVYVCRRISD